MNTCRVAVFGEILFDSFADGAKRLGGAPLNTAVHLAGLGERPLLISRVGPDRDGERALEALAAFGVDTTGIQRDPVRPTGEVRVDLVGGEPEFTILEERAWDYIDVEEAQQALSRAAPELLAHGVLAARSPASRQALGALRTATAEIAVDVNLRPPWTPRERALELCRGATLVKLNRPELTALVGSSAATISLDAAARELLHRSSASQLAVTMGDRGAVLFGADGERVAGDAYPLGDTSGGDPVGAGDAFAAVLLVGRLRGWPPRLTLVRAAELAASVCALRGALPEQPGWYHQLRQRWNQR